MASFFGGGGEGEVGSYDIGGDGQRAVCSDATTKQETENSFVVVNGEICGSPKQNDTFRENVKKISRKGTRKKKTTSRLTTNQIGIKQGSNEGRWIMKLVACGCGPFK